MRNANAWDYDEPKHGGFSAKVSRSDRTILSHRSVVVIVEAEILGVFTLRKKAVGTRVILKEC